MRHRVGIRREDKNQWEARVPITPDHVKALSGELPVDFAVQTSPIRVFGDSDYERAGASVVENLDDCPVVFAVKEIPKELLREGTTYIYFSHTIKGQPYNMEMLKRLMELKCQLIDYECIADEQGRRLVFFGRHAGLAGMIDTLWALGRRLEWEGIEPNPFAPAKQAFHYLDLPDAKEKLAAVGDAIAAGGLSETLAPMVFGFAGYGNVSQGAQEILDVLPVIEIEPVDLHAFFEKGRFSRNHVYKTVFHEKDLVVPREEGALFELQDYYDHPEKYRSAFNAYLPCLSVLMNCIFWTDDYPRLITNEEIAAHFSGSGIPRLRVVGEISCDPGGSIEFLLKTTDSGNPVFVYDPDSGEAIDGVAGKGPVLVAVDNLPCELPLESSQHFSQSLKPYLGAIATADYSAPFDELDLPAPIKKALIVHQGGLTPEYRYMKDFIH